VRFARSDDADIAYQVVGLDGLKRFGARTGPLQRFVAELWTDGGLRTADPLA
jgi:hypothetical protein